MEENLKNLFDTDFVLNEEGGKLYFSKFFELAKTF